MGKSLRDRRAVAPVLGAIILIAVLSASMFAVFSYQGYQVKVTREGMKAQQAITERIRENLKVTIIARSQNGDSAMLQIENTGLITVTVQPTETGFLVRKVFGGGVETTQEKSQQQP